MSYEDETAFMSCEDRNYARDRRVTATDIAPPAHGKFHWEICDLCSGHGKHVNPSIDASGLTSEDFAEDPDFAEQYFSGDYDVSCAQCHGRGSVVVIDDPIITRLDAGEDYSEGTPLEAAILDRCREFGDFEWTDAEGNVTCFGDVDGRAQ